MSELEITPEQARKEWAKDLRSGDYEQAAWSLRPEENKRCCLGVACDTYKRLTGKGSWEHAYFKTDEGNSTVLLPADVAEFFGFQSNNPFLEKQLRATYLNDEVGKTFVEIAELVEKL